MSWNKHKVESNVRGKKRISKERINLGHHYLSRQNCSLWDGLCNNPFSGLPAANTVKKTPFLDVEVLAYTIFKFLRVQRVTLFRPRGLPRGTRTPLGMVESCYNYY